MHPHLDARMPSAQGEYESVYGKISSAWNAPANGPYTLRVTIPPNAHATVFLPLVSGKRVAESGNPVEGRAQGTSYVIRVGSGTYNFEVK